MIKQNCWEAMNCGRHPDGAKAAESGVCPAALPNDRWEGIHGGKHSGRFCWVVAGTFCGGRVQGTYAKKLANCLTCRFLKQVNEDEGRQFILTPTRVKGGS
jgi:hypothetical protein